MAKVFFSYQQQIEKLVKEKDLLIADEEYAKEMLKRYSYYSLISGYKDIFKNTTTKTYKKGTRFEDIVNLYEFDASLRELFLKYLLRVEWEIKSLISYHFCEKFGENQVACLNINNYNTSGKNRTGVQKLVNVLNRYTSRPTDYNYINHAQNKYHNVPLWVLVNALTFGNMSKMYFYLPFDIQTKIAKNYPFVNEMQLAKLLAVTAQFRNICAHGERLYSYKTKNAIPDFPIHDKLGIIKKGKQYECGKHDLFAVVIALRYLLPKDLFKKFKQELANLLSKHLSATSCYTEKEFLKYMGFPENWIKITRYRKL